jgi:hypothetical protein
MKKTTLLAFAFAALSLASCKKARTCTCTGTTTLVTTQAGTINSGPVTTTSPEAYTEVLKSATKKTAKGKADCNSRKLTTSSEFTSGGTTTTEQVTQDFSCTIK